MLTIFFFKSNILVTLIKITCSDLRMLLTDFFNSQILNTLLKLLALTSECCCQAMFPTKKTEKKWADHKLTMTYPCYSIKITSSNLRMLLTDFFNSHILNTLLKLLALTSECCCQATFPTKKTKKKISWSRVDYDFALGSGRKCLWENENLCENIQWTKVISRRRKLLNADLLLNNIVKWKHKEIFSRASRTEGGRYTTSYNISSIDNFYEMES